jgi:hypothetical protein
LDYLAISVEKGGLPFLGTPLTGRNLRSVLEMHQASHKVGAVSEIECLEEVGQQVFIEQRRLVIPLRLRQD